MSGEFQFVFEELPLVVDLGFEAGLVNGSANVRYHENGEWHVQEIFLDGHRQRSDAERMAWMAGATLDAPKTPLPRFESKSIEIDDQSSQLYLAIWGQLTDGRFKDHIQDAVDTELADAGILLRSERQEHSTLNRAQQGV